MSVSTDNTLEAARRLVKAGCSVLPIKIDGTKAPAASVLPLDPDTGQPVWKPYQSERPTDEELTHWFGDGRRLGVAVIGGKVSGNLEQIDGDEQALLEPYCALVEQRAPGLVSRLVWIKTPRPSWRLAYRCEEPVSGNLVLARRLMPADENHPRPWPKALIETRGEGGYAIVPGSPAQVHETGRPYVLERGSLDAIPVISAAERQILLECARELNEYTPPEPAPRKPRSERATRTGLLPGTDFNERGDVGAIVTRQGWTLDHTAGEVEYWRRPGKSAGHSATLHYVAENCFNVFSTSAAPFEGDSEHGRGYDAFSVYTLLEHGGDYSAAAKELYRRGYGDRIEPEDVPTPGDGDTPPERTGGPPDAGQEAASTSSEARTGRPGTTTENKAGPRASLLTERLAEVIAGEGSYAQDAAGRLYLYEGGCYRLTGEGLVRRRVKALLGAWGEPWTSHRAREVTEFIRVDAPTLWERPPLDRVNLRNGLLDLTTGRLLDHSVKFLSSVQLPIAFDPNADCPNWRRFVGGVFPDDAGESAWELLAWVLAPELSIQRAVLLLGDGSNGKSAFLAGVSNFLGRGNVTSLTLQRLETDRFAVARLLGKLANICPDLPATHLQSSAMFKALTGDDSVTGEFKHRDSFDFIPFARLLFSANAPPRSADASPAFFRRWLVLPFTQVFEGDRAIPRQELDAQLAAPNELSGALNEALRRLPRLRSSGFSESESMRAAWRELRQVTDPLAVWLDIETVDDPAGQVLKRELCQAYRKDCARAGRPTLTENAFGRGLKQLRPGLKEAYRTTQGDERQWYWLGIRLRDAAAALSDRS